MDSSLKILHILGTKYYLFWKYFSFSDSIYASITAGGKIAWRKRKCAGGNPLDNINIYILFCWNPAYYEGLKVYYISKPKKFQAFNYKSIGFRETKKNLKNILYSYSVFVPEITEICPVSLEIGKIHNTQALSP